MPDLIHIVYVSISAEEMSEEELENLLAEIRTRNKQHKVTGLLLYNDGLFIQVIEGARETIHTLFELIRRDSRHINLVKVLEEPIEKRGFPDWSMGFRKISKAQSSRIPGFSDFMQAKDPEKLIKGTTEEVMYLLNSFRKHT